MATIKDVAELAGTSVATVSRVLNGESVRENNRQKVLEAIEKLQYKINYAAKTLKTNRTMKVGFVVPDITNIIFSHVAKGAQEYFCKNGYSMIILSSDNNPEREKQAISFLQDHSVDGLILISGRTEDGHLREIKEKGLPIVLVDRMLDGVGADAVLIDNVNGAYMAVEKLIEHGHRKIGVISGPVDIFTGKERFKGVCRVFEDYNLELDMDLVRFGDFEMESGYHLAKELLSQEKRPTALFVANYFMSIGAILAIHETNTRIPDELSFVGFDDMELSKVIKPPLTSVIQPMQEMGEKAAEILLKRINGTGPSEAMVVRLKPELIMRESIRAIET